MDSSSLSDLKKTTEVVESLYTTSTRCFVTEITNLLQGVKYVSTLDLQAGYLHIPLDDATIPKTAFTSPFGKYEYLKFLLD